MLCKHIKWTDFNGVEREEDFYFHLFKSDILEMELGKSGGLSEYLSNIIKTQDAPALISMFKDLICKSFGVKSLDGKSFTRPADKLEEFKGTEAFSQLFMELATDDEKALEFVQGILPADVQKEMQKADFKEGVEKVTKK